MTHDPSRRRAAARRTRQRPAAQRQQQAEQEARQGPQQQHRLNCPWPMAWPAGLRVLSRAVPPAAERSRPAAAAPAASPPRTGRSRGRACSREARPQRPASSRSESAADSVSNRQRFTDGWYRELCEELGVGRVCARPARCGPSLGTTATAAGGGPRGQRHVRQARRHRSLGLKKQRHRRAQSTGNAAGKWTGLTSPYPASTRCRTRSRSNLQTMTQTEAGRATKRGSTHGADLSSASRSCGTGLTRPRISACRSDAVIL